MTKAIKFIAIGNSTGAIFPKDVLAHLRLDRGDTAYLTETPDGGYRITPYNPEFERQMQLAETIMQQDRDILRVLAK